MHTVWTVQEIDQLAYACTTTVLSKLLYLVNGAVAKLFKLFLSFDNSKVPVTGLLEINALI